MFVDMSDAYDVEFRRLSRIAAGEAGITGYLREGSYAMVSGPSYETPAELRLLRILGVDAVGKSFIKNELKPDNWLRLIFSNPEIYRIFEVSNENMMLKLISLCMQSVLTQ